MKRIAPLKYADIPHPLVFLAGLVVAIAFLYLSLKGNLPPVTFTTLLVLYVVIFSVARRRSSHEQRQRRLRSMDVLRKRPVLHLSD